MRQAVIIATAASLLIAFKAGAQTNKALPPDWIATANQPCKVWNALPQPDQSVTWSGACVDGFASGKGTLRWMENGKPDLQYDGEYKDGKRNGPGVVTTADGFSVEGVWMDDNLILSHAGDTI
jgi:MORN repeat